MPPIERYLHTAEVRKQYVAWLSSTEPDVVIERDKHGMGYMSYFKKYLENSPNFPGLTYHTFWRIVRGLKKDLRSVEKEREMLANGEDDFAIRATIRLNAKKLLSRKMMEILTDEHAYSALTVADARKLYEAIRREEDSDRALILKAVGEKRENDRFELLREQLSVGALPEACIIEIKQAVKTIHDKYANSYDGRADTGLPEPQPGT